MTGCPGQPFFAVGQPKVDPRLPDRATKRFAICPCIYADGQPKCIVGQPVFAIDCPTGQPISITNAKPCMRVFSYIYTIPKYEIIPIW